MYLDRLGRPGDGHALKRDAELQAAGETRKVAVQRAPVEEVAPCRVFPCPDEVFEEDFCGEEPELGADEDDVGEVGGLVDALEDGDPDVGRDRLQEKHAQHRHRRRNENISP
jgi:hypothetical protein